MFEAPTKKEVSRWNDIFMSALLLTLWGQQPGAPIRHSTPLLEKPFVDTRVEADRA